MESPMTTNPILTAIRGLGTIVDTPRAMLWAALAGRNPLRAAINPAERIYGEDITGNPMAGMVLEALGDPLMLAGLVGTQHLANRWLNFPERRQLALAHNEQVLDALGRILERQDLRDLHIRRANFEKGVQALEQVRQDFQNRLKRNERANMALAMQVSQASYGSLTPRQAKIIATGAPQRAAVHIVEDMLPLSLVTPRRPIPMLSVRPNIYPYLARDPGELGFTVGFRPDMAFVSTEYRPGVYRGIPMSGKRPAWHVPDTVAHEAMHQLRHRHPRLWVQMYDWIPEPLMEKGVQQYAANLSLPERQAFLQSSRSHRLDEGVATLVGRIVARSPTIQKRLIEAAKNLSRDYPISAPPSELVDSIARIIRRDWKYTDVTPKGVQKQYSIPMVDARHMAGYFADAILGLAERRLVPPWFGDIPPANLPPLPPVERPKGWFVPVPERRSLIPATLAGGATLAETLLRAQRPEYGEVP